MDLLVLEMSSVTLSFWFLRAMSVPIWRYRNPYYLFLFCWHIFFHIICYFINIKGQCHETEGS